MEGKVVIESLNIRKFLIFHLVNRMDHVTYSPLPLSKLANLQTILIEHEHKIKSNIVHDPD